MSYEPLNLDEAAEWAGMWWLLDDVDNQIPGILRYDGNGGLLLSLIGAFEDRITSNPAPGVTIYHEGVRTWDVIHGVAEHREVTLLDCARTVVKRTYGARVKSPDTQTVRATIAIIGVHINGKEDSAFVRASVSVEDLGHWAASSALEGSLRISDDNGDETGTISTTSIETQTVTVDGTEYELVRAFTRPFFDYRKGGTVGRMRDIAFIRVCRAEAFTLSDALEAASLMQDLIALATHRAAGLIWLQLEVAGPEQALPNGKILPRRRADVLYSPIAIGKHDAKAVASENLFFTCETLPFEEVVSRWCEVHSRLKAAMNMILGLGYAPARFVENNLLTAVGAAEVLHRSLDIDEKPFREETFTAMRDAMLKQVPKEHRSRIKAAIRNDPTLRDRLHSLAGRPDSEAIAQLVPDIDYWAKRTTQARNHLAHTGTSTDSIDLLNAIVKTTTAVVLLNVLHELGLSAEQQRKIVQDHPTLRYTAGLARKRLVASETD